MTIPIISHSHEGVRINIDGVVEVYANSVYVAEAFARFKAGAQERAQTLNEAMEGVVKLRDALERVERGGNVGPDLAINTSDEVRIFEQGADELNAAIVEFGNLLSFLR